MAISLKFQKRLCQLLDNSEYTRTEARKAMPIGSSAFTNAVSYGILPTPKTLVKIADFFQVSMDYLLGKTDSNDFVPAVKTVAFYERFVSLCQEKSKTFYMVAKNCGFDNSLITNWQKKGFYPSLEILELLCKYFQVSPDYILGRSDFKN